MALKVSLYIPLPRKVFEKKVRFLFLWWLVDLGKEIIISDTEYKMPSENKQKIYIVLVIIFFGGVLEILPEQVTTIVPAILFIWETYELFFNKNALAGYRL